MLGNIEAVPSRLYAKFLYFVFRVHIFEHTELSSFIRLS